MTRTCCFPVWATRYCAAGLYRYLHGENTVLAGSCVLLLDRFTSCLAHAGLWLSEREQQAAYQLGTGFLNCYQALAIRSEQAGVFYFQRKPKLHQFTPQHSESSVVRANVHTNRFCVSNICWHPRLAHIVDSLKSSPAANPWANACWMDEDMVGKMMRVVHRCHPSSVQRSALDKYRLLLATQLGL